MTKEETYCDVQEVQSYVLYCSVWERGCITTFPSDKSSWESSPHFGAFIVLCFLFSAGFLWDPAILCRVKFYIVHTSCKVCQTLVMRLAFIFLFS